MLLQKVLLRTVFAVEYDNVQYLFSFYFCLRFVAHLIADSAGVGGIDATPIKRFIFF